MLEFGGIPCEAASDEKQAIAPMKIMALLSPKQEDWGIIKSS